MYTILRELADTWALVMLFLIFVGIIVWAFRPGTKKLHKDIADTPFRNDTLED